VKKDKREYTPDTDDIVKINLELQIMLNELILLNIAEPVVYGMVLQGKFQYLLCFHSQFTECLKTPPTFVKIFAHF
jgi:hypothetical protein